MTEATTEEKQRFADLLEVRFRHYLTVNGPSSLMRSREVVAKFMKQAAVECAKEVWGNKQRQ